MSHLVLKRRCAEIENDIEDTRKPRAAKRKLLLHRVKETNCDMAGSRKRRYGFSLSYLPSNLLIERLFNNLCLRLLASAFKNNRADIFRLVASYVCAKTLPCCRDHIGTQELKPPGEKMD